MDGPLVQQPMGLMGLDVLRSQRCRTSPQAVWWPAKHFRKSSQLTPPSGKKTFYTADGDAVAPTH